MYVSVGQCGRACDWPGRWRRQLLRHRQVGVWWPRWLPWNIHACSSGVYKCMMGMNSLVPGFPASSDTALLHGMRSGWTLQGGATVDFICTWTLSSPYSIAWHELIAIRHHCSKCRPFGVELLVLQLTQAIQQNTERSVWMQVKSTVINPITPVVSKSYLVSP